MKVVFIVEFLCLNFYSGDIMSEMKVNKLSQSTPSVCDWKNFVYHIIKPEQNTNSEKHSSGKQVSALLLLVRKISSANRGKYISKKSILFLRISEKSVRNRDYIKKKNITESWNS